MREYIQVLLKFYLDKLASISLPLDLRKVTDINLMMNSSGNFIDKSLKELSPFLNKKNSLETIIKEIKNDL